MNRQTSLTLLSFAVVGALALVGTARADADGPDYYRVVGVKPGSVLNFRSEPSVTAAKIGSIPHNADGIKNLGCKGGLSFDEWERATPERRAAARFERWCKVTYGNLSGWVAGWLITEGKAPKTGGEAQR